MGQDDEDHKRGQRKCARCGRVLLSQPIGFTLLIAAVLRQHQCSRQLAGRRHDRAQPRRDDRGDPGPEPRGNL